MRNEDETRTEEARVRDDAGRGRGSTAKRRLSKILLLLFLYIAEPARRARTSRLEPISSR